MASISRAMTVVVGAPQRWRLARLVKCEFARHRLLARVVSDAAECLRVPHRDPVKALTEPTVEFWYQRRLEAIPKCDIMVFRLAFQQYAIDNFQMEWDNRSGRMIWHVHALCALRSAAYQADPKSVLLRHDSGLKQLACCVPLHLGR